MQKLCQNIKVGKLKGRLIKEGLDWEWTEIFSIESNESGKGLQKFRGLASGSPHELILK